MRKHILFFLVICMIVDAEAQLIIKDGGVLTATRADSWTGVGYNNTGHLVVEAGGVLNTGHRFHVGMLEAQTDDAYAILEVAGTVNVLSNIFTIDNNGWTGQTATVLVWEGGRINTPDFRIGPNGHMDITGGLVVIEGDRDSLLPVYVAFKRITAEEDSEPATITVYHNVHDTVTVISCSKSPEYVDPAA